MTIMRPPTLSASHKNGVVCFLLGLLAVACVVASNPDSEAPHGWSGANGIVVPHDSFPADCMLCHQKGGWSNLRADFTFDHEASTGVKLEGAHERAQCLRCHNDRGPVSLFSSQGCAGCHEDTHQGDFGNQCASCHEQDNWSLRDELALHNRTRFPLVGSHAALQCTTCHPSGELGNWKSLDVACANCHLDQLSAQTSPDHVANNWLAACDRCHIPTTWDGAGFNHFAFVLDGAHRSANCSECHPSGMFAGVPSTCFGCHEADYLGTDDPDHAAGGFSTSCEQCHTTSTWDDANFSHAGIASGCINCHQADYDGTDDPDHGMLGFSTSCEECHNTVSWDDADFQHLAITNDCVSCHLASYNETTTPNHAAFSIPQTCETCHVTKTWLGASFDHGGVASNCSACHQADYNNTTNPNHPTAGVSSSCELCHGTRAWEMVNMNHAGVGSQCIACHQSDYNQTARPNHGSAGFPTSCDACHGTNSWTPATFSHQFPLTGPDHGGLSCTDCHAVPGNYRSFTCTDCHAHSFSEMADKHDRVRGYTWSSPACYSCHPNGKER